MAELLLRFGYLYIVKPTRELPQHLGETQYIARITEREDNKFDFFFSNDEKVALDNLDEVEFVGKVQIFKTEEEVIPLWFAQKSFA